MVSARDLAKRALVVLLNALATAYKMTLKINRDSSDADVRTAFRKQVQNPASGKVKILEPRNRSTGGRERREKEARREKRKNWQKGKEEKGRQRKGRGGAEEERQERKECEVMEWGAVGEERGGVPG